MKRNRVWQALLSLHLLALVLLGACSSPTEEELSPVVLVTVLGLNSDIVGLRATATLNTAPAMMEQEYKEGFGPSVVQFQFAVRLPARAQGRFELSLLSLTKEGCYLSENLHEQADVAPGQFVTMTVNLNRFEKPICPLTIEGTGGPGKVTWTSKPDFPQQRHTCESRCIAYFPIGTAVTLSATENAPKQFLQWGGACTGTSDCSLPIDGPKNVTAEFQRVLTVKLIGAANSRAQTTVISDPQGISCGTTCQYRFDPNTSVTLSVSSSAPACFAGWGAPCSGTGTCTVKIKESMQVEAQFAECTTQSTGASSTMNSIWASSSDKIWTASTRELTRFDGSTWTSELFNSPGGFPITGIWGSGTSGDILISTNGGGYLYSGSKSLTKIDTFSSLTSVWAVSPSDILFSTRNGIIYRSNGTGGYSPMQVAGSDIVLRHIAGVSSNDIWVVGDRGVIRHWDGSTWKAPSNDLGTATLNGVWATSPTSAWAVGAYGTVLNWNGTTWSKVEQNLTSELLTAVWAANPTDVWVTGGSGSLLHWDGRTWAKVENPSRSGLYSIHGPADAHGKLFWVGSSSGVVIKYAR